MVSLVVAKKCEIMIRFSNHLGIDELRLFEVQARSSLDHGME